MSKFAWIQDAVGLVGVGLLERGLWLVYKPAAFLVAGVLLLFVSWYWPAPPRPRAH